MNHRGIEEKESVGLEIFRLFAAVKWEFVIDFHILFIDFHPFNLKAFGDLIGVDK